jgi:hypothetical protein
MFNYETEYIIRKIQNRVLGSRDSVSLRLILSAPVHDAIKVYFRASVADKHGTPKRFHTGQMSDIDSLKLEIDLLLPSNFVFNKDTFTSLLTDAVHFQFNYLCRPRWTMKEFFFHQSNELTVPELKQGFLYFSAYDYYPKVLFRYLQRKNIARVDRNTFDEIIRKIDKLVLGKASPDDFAKLLQPFADFIAYGREDSEDSIPEHALALFFGDKGFDDIRGYLETTLQKQKIEKVTIDELRMHLTQMPEGYTAEKIQTPVTEIPDVSEEPSTTVSPAVETEEYQTSPIVDETRDEIPTDEEIIEEEIAEEEIPEVSIPEETLIGEQIPEETAIEEADQPLESEISEPEFLSEDIEDQDRDSDSNEEIPVIEEPFEEEPEDIPIEDSTEESVIEQEQEPVIGGETEEINDYDEIFRPIEEEQREIESFIEESSEEIPETDERDDHPIDDESEKEPQPDDFYEEPDEEEFIEEEESEEETNDTIPHDGDFDEADHEDIEAEEHETEEKPKRLSSGMPPLDLLIEDDERKRFVRKLFNGDSAYFNIVIQTLNKMTSWKEASLYLDEIFLMNGVDPYSTDSVNFTDKVYTRFSHKSKYKQ